MRVQAVEAAAPVDLLAKADPEKKGNQDLFALLMAALANVQAPLEIRPSGTEQAPNTNISQLLAALPEGTTVEHLLLNLPKELNTALQAQLTPVVEAVGDEAQVSDTLCVPVPDLPPFTALSDAVASTNPTAMPAAQPQVPPELLQELKVEAITLPLALNEQQAEVPVNEVAPVRSTGNNNLDTAQQLAGQTQMQAPISVGLPEISVESLQQLRTEIVSFSNSPVRPTITIEITPPEYGRVVVSAERDTGGQVMVRLVVETPAAKEAVAQQLPQMFASTPSSNTTVTVFTAEEYQEFREEQRGRNPDRNKREREQRQPENPHKVEFVI